MELHFCDLCSEAVPQFDIDRAVATVAGTRVICRRCNELMGSAANPASLAAGIAASASAQGGTSGDAKSPAHARKAPPLISSTLGGVLGLVAILLTLVAVVALLFRIEMVGRNVKALRERDVERISKLEMRTLGTRDGMVARAQAVAEDAVYKEMKRFETFERQLAELRLALAAGVPAEQDGSEDSEGTEIAAAPPQISLEGSSLLTLGDAMQRVDELEGQITFLQARVFELLEGGSIVTPAAEPKERLLLPKGEVGQLLAQLSHQDPIERVSALYALALVDDTGIVRHITPLLKDSDAYIRSLAARILERMGARSSVQSLIEALGDTDAAVREASVSALRSITGKQFRFDPRGRGSDRFEGVKRWKQWWDENWKTFLYSEE